MKTLEFDAPTDYLFPKPLSSLNLHAFSPKTNLFPMNLKAQDGQEKNVTGRIFK